MYFEYKQYRVYPVAVLMATLLGSVYSPVYAEDKPHEQMFVVTAYYSPEPNQCCYFRGSYEDEVTFNGMGISGADGTNVYPGMLAGPPTYAFGTVIELPGLGVGTIHDRGSRIIEWGDDVHRIDVWMGHGEEGLARALEWGTRTMKGTVYPVTSQNVPEQGIDLKALPSNIALLQTLTAKDPFEVLLGLAYRQVSFGVRRLQQLLKNLGYFNHAVTGEFGDKTKAALLSFQHDYNLVGDGLVVSDLIAATLLSAEKIEEKNLPDVAHAIDASASLADIRQAQKLLRYLGYYKGRTDGVYDEDVQHAIFSFQKDYRLVSTKTDKGAGRIGPVTRATILQAWKSKVAVKKAKNIVLKEAVKQIALQEKLPKKVLSVGDKGNDVRLLQEFLWKRGYAQKKDVTGHFGDRTKSSLLQYQKDKSIVTDSLDHGAGVFGPTTKALTTKEVVEFTWQQVRQRGVKSL